MSTVDRRAARAMYANNRKLAHDLAAFETPAEMAELAAILDRHDDAKAAPLRDLIDWTRAA